MDIHIWYTVLSAIVGGVLGARGRLGEVYGLQTDYFVVPYFLSVIVGDYNNKIIHGPSLNSLSF